MIGKPITGRSFGGCVRYLVNKQDAKILFAEGLRMQNAVSIIADFNLQRRMRPELGKAVGHLVLSWSKEDIAKLSDEVMVQRAKEYMEKVGIRNTQFVVVRHSDREHPHLHVIYNRVDNNGNTITDKNSFAKNIKACKEITLKYGYHLGWGKEEVNRQALKGKEKIRYELFDAIKAAAKRSVSWQQLEAALKRQGIGIVYKFRSGTNEVQGISFEKGDVKMKGSAIDRSLSYAGIDAVLNRNLVLQQSQTAGQMNQPVSGRSGDRINRVVKSDSEIGILKTEKSFLEALLEPEFVAGGPDPMGELDRAKRKKKKRRQDQSQSPGVSS